MIHFSLKQNGRNEFPEIKSVVSFQEKLNDTRFQRENTVSGW